jgi:hypothetical protein
VARMLTSGADTPTMPLPASGRWSSGFISRLIEFDCWRDVLYAAVRLRLENG